MYQEMCTIIVTNSDLEQITLRFCLNKIIIICIYIIILYF